MEMTLRNRTTRKSFSRKMKLMKSGKSIEESRWSGEGDGEERSRHARNRSICEKFR